MCVLKLHFCLIWWWCRFSFLFRCLSQDNEKWSIPVSRYLFLKPSIYMYVYIHLCTYLKNCAVVCWLYLKVIVLLKEQEMLPQVPNLFSAHFLLFSCFFSFIDQRSFFFTSTQTPAWFFNAKKIFLNISLIFHTAVCYDFSLLFFHSYRNGMKQYSTH